MVMIGSSWWRGIDDSHVGKAHRGPRHQSSRCWSHPMARVGEFKQLCGMEEWRLSTGVIAPKKS